MPSEQDFNLNFAVKIFNKDNRNSKEEEEEEEE